GDVVPVSNNVIRAKGISGLWKTSMSPTDASSGAIITLNKDGSMNLNVGVVEIGQGTKTTLIQILATSIDRKSTRLNSSHVSISPLFPYTTLFRSKEMLFQYPIMLLEQKELAVYGKRPCHLLMPLPVLLLL